MTPGINDANLLKFCSNTRKVAVGHIKACFRIHVYLMEIMDVSCCEVLLEY
jgi:hypothetical protein